MNNNIDDDIDVDKAKYITDILNDPINKMSIIILTIVTTIFLIRNVNIK
jgi:hypothetical protein